MLNRKQKDRRSTDHHQTSLIAGGTVVRGDLTFHGALHLDGRVEGTILAEGEDAMFTLSEHGQVTGEIRVPLAVINGQVTGDVYVSARLELAPQARIHGDVHYHTLEMAAGAQVNGRMARQGDDPPRELSGPDAELSDAELTAEAQS